MRRQQQVSLDSPEVSKRMRWWQAGRQAGMASGSNSGEGSKSCRTSVWWHCLWPTQAATAPVRGEAARSVVEEEGSAISGQSCLLSGTSLLRVGEEDARGERSMGNVEWTID